MVGAMNAVPGFHCPTSPGSFYAYVDVREALGRSYRGGVTPTTSAEPSARNTPPVAAR